MMINIVILAAGTSSRLGHPKQLVKYEGQTLLERAISTALQTRAHAVNVVLGYRSQELAPLIEKRAKIFVNEHFEEGLSSSIVAGVSSLPDTKSGGILFMLCDQPFLSSTHLNTLIDRFLSGTSKIVASQYEQKPGVPAIFHTDCHEDLMSLKGPSGAKALFQKYREELLLVPFPDGKWDIDTPEDLKHLQE